MAGFTNQKPARRQLSGYGPWVKLLYAKPGLASQGAALVEAAERRLTPHRWPIPGSHAGGESSSLRPAAAVRIYSRGPRLGQVAVFLPIDLQILCIGRSARPTVDNYVPARS